MSVSLLLIVRQEHRRIHLQNDVLFECHIKEIFKVLLKPAISPTNRNWAEIADINNKNQVSALSYFADTVNVSEFPLTLDNAAEY